MKRGLPEGRRSRALGVPRSPLVAGALAASLAFSCTHGASPSAQGSAPDPAGAPLAKDADDLLVVDCLLPGRVTKLGRKVTYLSPRRPVKTTAIDCEIRGGEYVSHDRADYRTALKVWQESAEQGDATAQNNVGEIYERGLGVAPDYTAAASWYGRAAEQGNAAAQLNLGQLYERGLGVPKDPARALALYEQARGVEGAADSGAAADAAQIAQLRADLEARDRQTEALGIEIQRLREELAREQREAQREDPAANERERQRLEEQRAALASERLALEAERRTLERQSAGQAASARESAEVADAAAERSAALERREAELDRGFAALAEREQKMAALGAEAASLGADAERKREQLAQLEQQIETLRREREERRAEIERLDARPLEVAALAAPSIRMIEPSLLAKRGVGLVEVVHASGAEQLLIGHVQAPAGLAQLTVNGAKAEVDGHGIFEQRIPVDDPETKVSIVATDEQGLRETLALVLKPRRGDQAASEQSGKPVSFGAPPAPALPPIDFGHYTALVIGNDNYRSLPDLDTARADAEAIGRILRSRYQFEVVELYDATRYEILSKLNELRGRLTEKDNLLIYYAGHGQLDEVNNRGHWQPVDAELESTANWLSNIDLTDILNAMSAKHVLVVADSCYAGTLTRSSLARLEAGMTPEALAERRKQMVGKRSRTALTSGGLSPVLDAGGGGHSIFAKALIKVLEENDSVLEAQNLAAAISALVAYAAEAQSFEQMPEYAPLKSGGHEAGDFFFVPAPPSV